MASISARKNSSPSIYSPGQGLSIIVGLACIAGFVVDLAIISLPPDPFNIQWRISILQQVGDRSVVLLFGLALLMFGLLDSRGLRKRYALFCLMLGVAFTLSGVLVVRDSLKFQSMAISNITNQEAEVRTQIESARSNPQELSPELTPEILQQASEELSQRADSAKQSTKTSVLKVGASSVGNLIVSGLALIFVGRFGVRA